MAKTSSSLDGLQTAVAPSAPVRHPVHATRLTTRVHAAVASRRRVLAEASRSLWFKPALALVIALALGALLSSVDVSTSGIGRFAFGGSANDGRQLLIVVTGTMITVTSLVFGLTVVTLQVASTQFSPRLLRSFLRDRGTQAVLSTFVGTVSYSLAGLHTVGRDDNGTPFVPRLAISGSLVLALISVAMLVYYIGHMTNAIRIDSIMRRVESDTRRVLNRDHPVADAADGDPDRVDLPAIPDRAVTIVAPSNGYVQGVERRLLPLAAQARVTVVLVQVVGYYVVAGRPLAVVWSDDGGMEPDDAALDAVARLIDVDPERRIESDVGLGFRQLVDVTSRAMSTGQNDAYTATQAVHHLTSLLADGAKRKFRPERQRDADGHVRVVIPRMSFPTHLKVVCSHLRQGGLERHPRVVVELLRMLATTGDYAMSQQRVDAVRSEVESVIVDARRMIQTPSDLDEVLELGTEVLTVLDRSNVPALV